MKRFSVSVFILCFALSAGAREISTNDIEGVCNNAGLSAQGSAAVYTWFVANYGEQPVYVSSAATYPTKASFYSTDSGKWEEKEVTAYADYRTDLVASVDKPTSISLLGGIAALGSSKKNFKVYLGYKQGGQDSYLQMKFEESPTASYNRYSLEVPAKTWALEKDTQVWFEGRYEDEQGKEARVYVSNGGANYHVKVTKNADKAICFAEGWREALTNGPLKAGEAVKVAYNHSRIISLLNGTSYNGYPAWNFTGYYEVRNAEGTTVASGNFPGTANLSNPQNGSSARERGKYATSVYIPSSAKGGTLALWFQGYARGGSQWDSAKGENYIVKIQ